MVPQSQQVQKLIVSIFVEAFTTDLTYNPVSDIFLDIFKVLKKQQIFQKMLKNINQEEVSFINPKKPHLVYRKQLIHQVIQQNPDAPYFQMVFSPEQLFVTICIEGAQPFCRSFGSNTTIQFFKSCIAKYVHGQRYKKFFDIFVICVNETAIKNQELTLREIQNKYGVNPVLSVKSKTNSQLLENQNINQLSQNQSEINIDLGSLARMISDDRSQNAGLFRKSQQIKNRLTNKYSFKHEQQYPQMINYVAFTPTKIKDKIPSEEDSATKNSSKDNTQYKKEKILPIQTSKPKVSSDIRSDKKIRNHATKSQQKDYHVPACCGVKSNCIIY